MSGLQFNEEAERSFRRFLRFSAATDSISKELQKFKNEKLSEFGLRSMHLMFLCCLCCSDNGMTLGELAQSCGVDKAFISRVTRELCSMGYIDYAGEHPYLPLQKYKKHLILTESGKNVMERIINILDDAVNKITAGISAEQFDTFYAVLSRLEGNLAEL